MHDGLQWIFGQPVTSGPQVKPEPSRGADFGFFARFDAEATWLGQMRSAFGVERFFFEDRYAAMLPAA